jgi:putative ABC transport system permease protein
VEENKKITYKELSNYKTNDEITLESINGNKKQTYQIGAVTEQRTYGLEGQYSDALILVLNNDYIKEETEIERILINAKDPEKTEEKLKEIDNIYINNLASEVKAMKTMILILSIFIYGFITVVTLIGITSVFNTITSNMELRQKDFATLKSIGMTKSEFNRMITLESLFYSFKSLVIGIILGLLGSYAIYKLLSRGIDFGYVFPYKAIIISILFITIVVFIIMRYSIKKVNKQNIIETIRRDNI